MSNGGAAVARWAYRATRVFSVPPRRPVAGGDSVLHKRTVSHHLPCQPAFAPLHLANPRATSPWWLVARQLSSAAEPLLRWEPQGEASETEAIGLRSEVVGAMHAVGAQAPSGVQAAATPLILSGRDVWLSCHTGSGKTLAYLAPIFSALRQLEVDDPTWRLESRRPRALVLAPTVELVGQITRVAKDVSHHARLKVLGLDGPQGSTRKRLLQGVDIVVATPGRVQRMRDLDALYLTKVSHIVLDEADTLLDESFIEDTLALVQACKPDMAPAIAAVLQTPEIQRRKPRPPAQLIAVGATMRRESYELLKRMLPKMELAEGSGRVNRPPPAVRQRWVTVDFPDTKMGNLMRLIRKHPSQQTLVFCNKSSTCSFVTQSLQEHGLPAVALHGDLRKPHRRQNLRNFRKDGGVLVATDVGARGLDFPDVRLVILYEPPPFASEYLHRVGRTGRAGKAGLAVTLVGRKDGRQAAIIQQELRSEDDAFRGVLSTRSRVAVDRQVAAEVEANERMRTCGPARRFPRRSIP